jgi:acyl carrier protein
MFGSRSKCRKRMTSLVLEATRDFLVKRGMEAECSVDTRLSQEGPGLDSIAFLELLAEIERHCGVEIPERHWGDLAEMTVGKLVDIVVRR